ncbi:hypothetical protein SAMN04490185_3193 [Pseudomonas frederiksbergensis]|uniref:HipA-like kinase domain-containing protein n=1 Tax=Pseudomonas frederiksbergensis TaxID=104087 RepID=A0A1H4ZIH6_9PSED|nr:HipA family kinase [Pseudomonas frederiksbergensis]SED29231.1 hypothetical protein SAMN04490185_3193 [Pseudomonas frederiksbergensis]
MTDEILPGNDSDPTQEPGKRLPVEARYQKTLIPVDAITTFTSTLGTADLKTIVEGRDGKHYAVKTTSDGAGKIPASELFCYELAYRVVIPTPSYSLIKLPTGELAFGSAWEGGVINGNSKIDYPTFIDNVLRGNVKVTNLQSFFSRLYAFDLFVNNVDRHWNNYLWRTSFGDSLIALAFDFSKACFEVGHSGFEATHPSTKTQLIFSMLNVSKNYIRAEAVACLEEIRVISSEDVSTILENFPSSWMSKHDRKSYIDWWSSQARHDRIDSLMKLL